MTTVQIKVNDEHPPPTGNPISLHCLGHWASELSEDLWASEMICSPQIWLPSGFELVIKSAIPGLFITSHEVFDGNINLITHFGTQWHFPPELEGKLVAYAHIVEKPLAKVRFVHKDSKGRRIVTGDARPIENCDNTSDTQPGE